MAAEVWQTSGEWPAAEIGALESQWPGMSMAQAYECEEMRFDAAADEYARRRGHADARAYHAALARHISEHGIVNPIGLGPAEDQDRFSAGVTNGQHRFFAALDCGLAVVPAGPNNYSPMPLVEGWDYPFEHEAKLEAG
jgi:hypothetical protein